LISDGEERQREERRRHSQVWLCTEAVRIEQVFGAVRNREGRMGRREGS
jgi:hypothetical protein